MSEEKEFGLRSNTRREFLLGLGRRDEDGHASPRDDPARGLAPSAAPSGRRWVLPWRHRWESAASPGAGALTQQPAARKACAL